MTKNLIIIGLIGLLGFFIWVFLVHIHQKDCFMLAARADCESKNMTLASFIFDGSHNYFCIKNPNLTELIGFKFSQAQINLCIGDKI